MGLRLGEGVDLGAMSARFGIPADGMIDADRLGVLIDLSLAWRAGDRIGVTPAGMPLLDALLGEMVHGDLVAA